VCTHLFIYLAEKRKESSFHFRDDPGPTQRELQLVHFRRSEIVGLKKRSEERKRNEK
jgi:hypothetical protein